MRTTLSFVVALLLLCSCARGSQSDSVPPHAGPHPARYDVIIRGGSIYDGSGGDPISADLAIVEDRIAAIGDLTDATADITVDATDLAVAPGFINMLSWAMDALVEDGRSQSDIRQGVTLEVFGEGLSYGPLDDAVETMVRQRQGDIRYEIEWTSLGEHLEYLVEHGVSPNVASFVGATTVRVHELGFQDRPPSPEELRRMQELVRAAMREGAVGVGASLIYAPASYAETDELVALATAAAELDGMYIVHMRSEANAIMEGLAETLDIARRSKARTEIYHLKAAGRANWSKLDAVIETIEQARAEGLPVTANIYDYTAGCTGLNATMPGWVQEGGHDAWVARLRDEHVRQRLRAEMADPRGWESLYELAGSPEHILLVGFKNDALKPLTGKTLAEAARLRNSAPLDTIMDLVVEDDSRVVTVYFLMDEANVEKKIALPWVSFGSDAPSQAPEGAFLRSSVHPRAYGNVARLLGRYVREREVITLQEAIRKLTSLPAENLRLRDRGRLREGFMADVVVFDPATIADVATYDDPQRYAVGMKHVFVNGTAVLRDGEHTGATPGRVVRGPGWVGWSSTTTPGLTTSTPRAAGGVASPLRRRADAAAP